MESVSSVSSKRARAPIIGIATVACLVDGCTADLGKCRDYHRRHKVCELHSKTPLVTINGQEQRFCQQCSRFHSLVEFDEGKRSCRKRLDGHNRRRRKPQPETFSVGSGGFFSGHQGTKYLNFGDPQVYSTSPTGSTSWSSPVKADNEAIFYTGRSQLNFIDRQSSMNESFSHGYKGGKQQLQFPFLQGEVGLPGAAHSPVQPFFEPKCSSSNSQRKCSDGFNRVLDTADGRALSLLSSSLAESQDASMSCCIPQAQPFMPGSFNYQERSLLVSDANLNCQEMFQPGPHGPSPNGPHHRLSFSWD